MFYKSNSEFNENRRVVTADEFRQTTIEAYMEYGAREHLTLGMKPEYSFISRRDRETGETTTNKGATDPEFWARWRIWHSDYSAFSYQQLIQVPAGYDRRDDPALGYNQIDLESRLLFGTSDDKGTPWYATIEVAYRKRFGGPADEIRVDGGLNIEFIKPVSILLESVNTFGMRNASSVTINNPTAPDFDEFKEQISLMVDVVEPVKVQVGYAKDLAGRNTGNGRTFIFAVHVKV